MKNFTIIVNKLKKWIILKLINLFLINNNFHMKFILKTKKGINYYLKIYYKSKLLEKIPFDQTNLLNYLS